MTWVTAARVPEPGAADGSVTAVELGERRVVTADLVERLRCGLGDVLLFGITPPKASVDPERLRRITDTTLARLRTADPDGVVLYDIAEEHDRNPSDRPFPFLPTLDPAEYLADQLSDWRGPAVVYRAVGKYSEAELTRWLREQSTEAVATVLVGASASDTVAATSLRRGYELRREVAPELLTGAVLIPERHTARQDEHLRMLHKQQAGVSFFVSQILYDVNAAKNVVVDYRDACDEQGVAPRPIIFTHSVCGSVKTLEFLGWLGVQVPHWMQRDLRRAESTLEASCEQARTVAADMVAYCRRLGVPVGLNVESVSSRRAEIEAAVQLATDFRALL